MDETEEKLKVYALEKLNSIVDLFWAEIADSVSKMYSSDFIETISEVLYENEAFKSRNLAALVASKVYYHLGEYEEALVFALGAGNLFNAFDKSDFVETIIGMS